MPRTTVALATTAVTFSLTAGTAFADGPSTDRTQRCDNGSITLSGPESLWPPNHKYRDLVVTAKADNDMMMTSLTTTVTHDEMLPDGSEMNGAGHTAEDATVSADTDASTGTAVNDVRIRAERSGRGDGRVYTITATTNFSDMAAMSPTSCTRTFTVTVPHDQGVGSGKPTTAAAKKAAARAKAKARAQRRAAARRGR